MTLRRSWILFTVLLVVFWGVWGAFSSKPSDDYGYPDQMIYVIWAFTMLIPCFFALRGNAFDRRRTAALYGLAIGLTGAGGQLVLFRALTIGPAWLIFPIVSVSPAITVALALAFLRERTARLGAVGVAFALVAIVLLSISDTGSADFGGGWLPLALLICAAWGIQAFLMRKASTAGVDDGSIFGWMTISGLLLVPVALLTMSDPAFGYTWKAPALTAATQVLNAIGALFLVMALSRGKAVVVAPAANALAPVLTVVLSLIIYATMPSAFAAFGIVFALAGSALIVYSEERQGEEAPAEAPENPSPPAPGRAGASARRPRPA